MTNTASTTKAIETISAPAPQAKRKPGRPALYSAAERAERARAATKRSQQRRVNRIAGDLDAATEALTSINVARLSKDDKASFAAALQAIANTRAEFTVKEVDVPDNEFGDVQAHTETETEPAAEDSEHEVETEEPALQDA